MSATIAMEVLDLEDDDAGARGQVHGEAWRAAIHELAAIRLELLIREVGLRSIDEALTIGGMHLPLLAATLPELHAELLGVARGAAIAPEAIVVLNHYTDLRDLTPAILAAEGGGSSTPGRDLDAGGCTAIYIPGVPGVKPPVLGQTWDMHASAAPYVRLLRVRPRSSDRERLLFTLAGCLGMCGVNERGVAVTINNLTCTDAQIGLVWPALVRALLERDDAASARDYLLAARLTSGHHYMIADGRDFYGVECSGQKKMVTQTGAGGAHLHTNHCFDPVLRRVETVPRRSTTWRRFELATSLFVMRPPRDARALWELLASHEGAPRSLCSHVAEAEGDPSRSETCGRIVMDLGTGEVLASAGCAEVNPARTFRLDRWRGGLEPTP
ncbi:MAG: C45 family peptidase [Nannocystaceae bacterium]